MGNVAASGGYWIATPADRIFAEPETLTGSIGVFAVVPTFEELLAEYGVTSDGVQTTPLSGQPDLLGGFTPETEAVLQASVEAQYGRFVGLVAASRGISRARADELGQGRVWTGGAARQLGLVDQFGGLDEAIAYAAQQAQLDEGEWQPRYLESPVAPFPAMLAQMFGTGARTERTVGGRDLFALLAAGEREPMARLMTDLARIFALPGVQARCLECLTAMPASAAPAAPAAPASGSEGYSLLSLARQLGWSPR
jgi:protease-4